MNLLMDFLLDPKFGGAVLVFLFSLTLFHWCFIWRRAARGRPPITDYQWKSFDYVWYTLGFFSAIMLVANVTFSQMKVTKGVYESNVAAVRSSVQDALYGPISECIENGVPVTYETAEESESTPGLDETVASIEKLDLRFHLKYRHRYETSGTRNCEHIGKIWNNVVDGVTVDDRSITLSEKEFTDDDHSSLINNWNHWITGYREVSDRLSQYEGLTIIYGNWSLIFAVAVALRITKASGERKIALIKQPRQAKPE